MGSFFTPLAYIAAVIVVVALVLRKVIRPGLNQYFVVEDARTGDGGRQVLHCKSLELGLPREKLVKRARRAGYEPVDDSFGGDNRLAVTKAVRSEI